MLPGLCSSHLYNTPALLKHSPWGSTNFILFVSATFLFLMTSFIGNFRTHISVFPLLLLSLFSVL
jgi:hypothetical protein